MVDVLSHWLEQNGCCAKKFGREFSNAVLVARLLKRINPRLVDLHNYPIINNTPEKIENWATLNKKVLRRIGLTLTADMMWQLAMGNSRVIIWLLTNIMHKAVYQKKPISNPKVGFKKQINEFGVVNKMYKRVLSTVKTKIQELEGSLRTIDDVYAKSLNKCYFDVMKKDYLYNRSKFTKPLIESSNLLQPIKKKKGKLIKKNNISNITHETLDTNKQFV